MFPATSHRHPQAKRAMLAAALRVTASANRYLKLHLSGVTGDKTRIEYIQQVNLAELGN
ncbi:MAG: hypothetical protein ABR880_11415 [Candidatus Sulfotelmatobacter sp.]|jgi:hypothetical protein